MYVEVAAGLNSIAIVPLKSHSHKGMAYIKRTEGAENG